MIVILHLTNTGHTSHYSYKKVRFCLREASYVDFVHEKRHMDVLLETPTAPPPPPPVRNVKHVFRFSRGSCGIVYLAGFKIECCYESIKVHLRQSQELIISVQSCILKV